MTDHEHRAVEAIEDGDVTRYRVGSLAIGSTVWTNVSRQERDTETAKARQWMEAALNAKPEWDD